MDKQQTTPNWLVLDDSAAVAEFARADILGEARRAIEHQGEFKLVLAGGRTPVALYRKLADCMADWPCWKIYLGDERCLPVNDAQRNSKAAQDAWLSHVAMISENIFFIPAQWGSERAAQDYEKSVQRALPFDLVLLGMGEDGHTASLFPGHEEPLDRLVLSIKDAPKPPPERVSLSSRALSSSSRVLILVTGADKRAAVARWRAGEALPVSRIGARDRLQIVLDRDAAGEAF